MTSAKEIRHYLADNTTFLKVIRSRKLSRFPSPSTFRLPKTLIVHSTSSNSGKEEKDKIGHWISILLTDNEALLFDSFGRKPNDFNIINYVFKYYNCVYFNCTPLQHITSINCGLFCISVEEEISSTLYQRK